MYVWVLKISLRTVTLIESDFFEGGLSHKRGNTKFFVYHEVYTCKHFLEILYHLITVFVQKIHLKVEATQNQYRLATMTRDRTTSIQFFTAVIIK